ncbi:MAG: hypothetical protein LHV68_13570, partial [Elusimicrobia bacterium]|nr:hypothetical protein [Candidatus Liberimonas magnetica]
MKRIAYLVIVCLIFQVLGVLFQDKTKGCDDISNTISAQKDVFLSLCLSQVADFSAGMVTGNNAAPAPTQHKSDNEKKKDTKDSGGLICTVSNYSGTISGSVLKSVNSAGNTAVDLGSEIAGFEQISPHLFQGLSIFLCFLCIMLFYSMPRGDIDYSAIIMLYRAVRSRLTFMPGFLFYMRKVSFKKTTAVLTTIIFVYSSVLSQPLLAAKERIDNNREYKNIFDGLVLPASYGRITDSYFVRGTKNGEEGNYAPHPVVVNIQDLHCHPEVQRNISKIIELLDQKYNLKNVYVEGACGKVDTAWLTQIGGKELKNKIVNSLIDSGKLTGAEYYSVTSGRTDLLIGVDDKKLHTDNLVRLNTITEKQDNMQNQAAKLDNDLEGLKKRYYNDPNMMFEKIVAKHKNGNIEVNRYYMTLLKYAKKLDINYLKFKNVIEFIDAFETRDKLNYKSISRELQGFITVLKQKLPYSAYNMLAANTANFSQANTLYVYLAKIANQYPSIIKDYPNLQQFFRHIEITQKVNPVELVREEQKLVDEIRLKLAVKESEREIVFLNEFSRYLKDYLAYKVSVKDYEYVSKNLSKFELFYKKYVGDSKLSSMALYISLLKDYYKVNLERNSRLLSNCFTSNKAKPFSSQIEQVNTLISGQNLNDEIEANGVNISKLLDNSEILVLVTGGFHTDGIKDLLKEKEISYITITPNVTKDTLASESIYKKLLKEQGGFFTKSMSGSTGDSAFKSDGSGNSAFMAGTSGFACSNILCGLQLELFSESVKIGVDNPEFLFNAGNTLFQLAIKNGADPETIHVSIAALLEDQYKKAYKEAGKGIKTYQNMKLSSKVERSQEGYKLTLVINNSASSLEKTIASKPVTINRQGEVIEDSLADMQNIQSGVAVSNGTYKILIDFINKVKISKAFVPIQAMGAAVKTAVRKIFEGIFGRLKVRTNEEKEACLGSLIAAGVDKKKAETLLNKIAKNRKEHAYLAYTALKELANSVTTNELAKSVIDITLLNTIADNSEWNISSAYQALQKLVYSVKTNKLNESVLDKDLLTTVAANAKHETNAAYKTLQEIAESKDLDTSVLNIDLLRAIAANTKQEFVSQAYQALKDLAESKKIDKAALDIRLLTTITNKAGWNTNKAYEVLQVMAEAGAVDQINVEAVSALFSIIEDNVGKSAFSAYRALKALAKAGAVTKDNLNDVATFLTKIEDDARDYKYEAYQTVRVLAEAKAVNKDNLKDIAGLLSTIPTGVELKAGHAFWALQALAAAGSVNYGNIKDVAALFTTIIDNAEGNEYRAFQALQELADSKNIDKSVLNINLLTIIAANAKSNTPSAYQALQALAVEAQPKKIKLELGIMAEMIGINETKEIGGEQVVLKMLPAMVVSYLNKLAYAIEHKNIDNDNIPQKTRQSGYDAILEEDVPGASSQSLGMAVLTVVLKTLNEIFGATLTGENLQAVAVVLSKAILTSGNLPVSRSVIKNLSKPEHKAFVDKYKAEGKTIRVCKGDGPAGSMYISPGVYGFATYDASVDTYFVSEGFFETFKTDAEHGAAINHEKSEYDWLKANPGKTFEDYHKTVADPEELQLIKKTESLIKPAIEKIKFKITDAVRVSLITNFKIKLSVDTATSLVELAGLRKESRATASLTGSKRRNIDTCLIALIAAGMNAEKAGTLLNKIEANAGGRENEAYKALKEIAQANVVNQESLNDLKKYISDRIANGTMSAEAAEKKYQELEALAKSRDLEGSVLNIELLNKIADNAGSYMPDAFIELQELAKHTSLININLLTTIADKNSGEYIANTFRELRAAIDIVIKEDLNRSIINLALLNTMASRSGMFMSEALQALLGLAEAVQQKGLDEVVLEKDFLTAIAAGTGEYAYLAYARLQMLAELKAVKKENLYGIQTIFSKISTAEGQDAYFTWETLKVLIQTGAVNEGNLKDLPNLFAAIADNFANENEIHKAIHALAKSVKTNKLDKSVLNIKLLTAVADNAMKDAPAAYKALQALAESKSVVDVELLTAIAANAGPFAFAAYGALQRLSMSVEENELDKSALVGLLTAIAANASYNTYEAYEILRAMAEVHAVNKDNLDGLKILFTKIPVTKTSFLGNDVYKTLKELAKSVKINNLDIAILDINLLNTIAAKAGNHAHKAYKALQALAEAKIVKEESLDDVKNLFTAIADSAKDKAPDAYDALKLLAVEAQTKRIKLELGIMAEMIGINETKEIGGEQVVLKMTPKTVVKYLTLLQEGIVSESEKVKITNDNIKQKTRQLGYDAILEDEEPGDNVPLASVYNTEAIEKWGEDSLPYKLYTSLVINWEIVLSIPLLNWAAYILITYFDPSRVVKHGHLALGVGTAALAAGVWFGGWSILAGAIFFITASAYVFSGIHKDREGYAVKGKERAWLFGVGSVLTGALLLPYLLFSLPVSIELAERLNLSFSNTLWYGAVLNTLAVHTPYNTFVQLFKDILPPWLREASVAGEKITYRKKCLRSLVEAGVDEKEAEALLDKIATNNKWTIPSAYQALQELAKSVETNKLDKSIVLDITLLTTIAANAGNNTDHAYKALQELAESAESKSVLDKTLLTTIAANGKLNTPFAYQSLKALAESVTRNKIEDKSALDIKLLTEIAAQTGTKVSSAYEALKALAVAGIVKQENLDDVKTLLTEIAAETYGDIHKAYEVLEKLARTGIADKNNLKDVKRLLSKIVANRYVNETYKALQELLGSKDIDKAIIDITLLSTILTNSGYDAFFAYKRLKTLLESKNLDRSVLNRGLLTAIAENAGKRAYVAYQALKGFAESVEKNILDKSVLNINFLTAITTTAKNNTDSAYKALQALLEADIAKQKNLNSLENLFATITANAGELYAGEAYQEIMKLAELKDFYKSVLDIGLLTTIAANTKEDHVYQAYESLKELVESVEKNKLDISFLDIKFLTTIAASAGNNIASAYKILQILLEAGIVKNGNQDDIKTLFAEITDSAKDKAPDAYNALKLLAVEAQTKRIKLEL